MHPIVIAASAAGLMLMGVNGRIDVSERGRRDATLPASGIHPLTEDKSPDPIVIGPPISGYHAESQAYFDLVEAQSGGGLTALQKTLIDAFVVREIPRRFKWVRFGPFGGTNLASSLPVLFHGTNIDHYVGYTNDVATAFVEGDFAAAVGLTGDGSSKYLSTGVSLTNAAIGQNCGYVSWGSFGAAQYTNAAPIGTEVFAAYHYEHFYNGGGAFQSYLGGLQSINFSVPTKLAISCRTAADAMYGLDDSGEVKTNSNAVAADVAPTEVTVFKDTDNRYWPSFLGCYGIIRNASPADLIEMAVSVSNLMTGFGR